MKNLYFITLLLLSVNIKAASIEELSKHERWLRLLHYRTPMFGKRVSIIDNVNKFFFAANGNESAIDELRSTITAFQSLDYNKSKLKWHPQCAYPARLKFIKKNTDLKFPKVECKEFQWWKNRVKAKSISLVFSSYYTGNPASMFGHTLIKLNTDENEGKISDFTFNFAAMAGEDKGLTYIIKGLSGGFQGTFSTEPYYVKVNDYVQGESRDVWEYLLDLNEDEVDWVVKHIWELKSNAIFDYYFLDENCSYILLAVIDAAKLSWNTSRGFYYYTLPVTTIKRVDEANGIKAMFYRPSFRKKMMERVSRLDSHEKKKYFNILSNKELIKTEKNRKVLEAYIAFLRYKQYEEGDDSVHVKTIRADLRPALIARARLGGKTEPVTESIKQRNLFDDPRNSHETYTMQLKYGKHSVFNSFSEFNFRFGVHDLMNNGLGLPRYSNIDILSFNFRYYFDSKKIELDRLKFIDMRTLIDFDSITKEISWGIRAEAYRPKDFTSNDLVVHVRPVAGLSKHLFNGKLNLYILGLLDIELGSMPKDQSFRVGTGAELGAIGYLSDKLKFKASGEAVYDFVSKFERKGRFNLDSQLGYSFGQFWEAKVGFQNYSSTDKIRNSYSESSVTGIYFF